jgi:hypothetical protein
MVSPQFEWHCQLSFFRNFGSSLKNFGIIFKMAVIISFTFFNIRIIGNSDGQISSSNFCKE